MPKFNDEYRKNKRKGIELSDTEHNLVAHILAILSEADENQTKEQPVELSRVVRVLSEIVGNFWKRTDQTDHDSHEGYIYVLRDPLIDEDKSIVYVGSSREPHQAVAKHLTYSPNKRLRTYINKWKRDNPDLIIMTRGTEVYDKFYGDIEEFPETYEEKEEQVKVWEWEILEEVDHASQRRTIKRNTDGSIAQVFLPAVASPRVYWTQRLREEGNPLCNGKSGRPMKE